MEQQLFQVTRNCCTSGNCFECRDVTPFGKSLRVIQGDRYTKSRAEQVAQGWALYGAKLEPMGAAK